MNVDSWCSRPHAPETMTNQKRINTNRRRQQMRKRPREIIICSENTSIWLIIAWFFMGIEKLNEFYREEWHSMLHSAQHTNLSISEWARLSHVGGRSFDDLCNAKILNISIWPKSHCHLATPFYCIGPEQSHDAEDARFYYTMISR